MSESKPPPSQRVFETPTLEDFNPKPPFWKDGDTYVGILGLVVLIAIVAAIGYGGFSLVKSMVAADAEINRTLDRKEKEKEAKRIQEDTENALKSFCIVNGLGNKLCGEDAIAYCDLRIREDAKGNLPLDADSRAACEY